MYIIYICVTAKDNNYDKNQLKTEFAGCVSIKLRFPRTNPEQSGTKTLT